jgi:hypothetical protein
MFRKLLPGLVVAIGVALVAGGAALAFGGGGGDPDGDLLADVAERLGLEPAQVEAAFAQAKREQTDGRVGELLALLVESGTVTQAQSDEASGWFKARPDAADKLSRFGFAGGLLRSKGGHGGGFPGLMPPGVLSFNIPSEIKERMAEKLGIDLSELEQAFSEARASAAAGAHMDAIKAEIDRLVESGEISEDEGDALKAWIDDMPEWLAGGQYLGRLLGHDLQFIVPETREFRRFKTPEFEAPDYDHLPEFRFEFRPHRFPFGPGSTAPVGPTPTPDTAATEISRPA